MQSDHALPWKPIKLTPSSSIPLIHFHASILSSAIARVSPPPSPPLSSLGFRRLPLETMNTMSPAAIRYADDLPPGFKFVPTDEQIVELYLMPRIRGEPELIPDLIVDDDTAANTQPWKLFGRHGLERQPDGVPAFFFVRTKDARPGARPERACDGGGKWKSMKSEREQVLKLVDGEEMNYTRHNLNFQMGEGSIGWVMHEYTVIDHPSLRICGISFSGHCKKRMRAPDDCLVTGEPVTRRPRLAAAADTGSLSSASWTFDQDSGAAHPASEDQEPAMPLLSDDEITAMVQEMSNAQEPVWAFQQEHLHTMAQTSEDEEIAAMIAEMTNPQPQPLMVSVMEAQVHQEEEPDSMFDARSYMDLLMTPSSCSLPHLDSMATGTHGGVVSFEGFEIELC